MTHQLSPRDRYEIDKVGGCVIGGVSGLLNVTLTFPLNKLMFRQQLLGVEWQSAFEQLRREGVRFLYRGVGPPLFLKCITTATMYGSFEGFQPGIVRNFPQLSYSLVLSASGCLAGLTEACLGTSFERVQTLLQDRKYHNVYRHTLHAYQDLGRFGFREYYTGFTPIVIRNIVSNIVYFSLKDEVYRLLPRADTRTNFYVNLFVSGALTGAIASTIVYPLNVVKTSMQAQCGTRKSLPQAFLQVYNERGRSLRKLYLGVHVNYTRSFMSWGVVNMTYEGLAKLLYDS